MSEVTAVYLGTATLIFVVTIFIIFVVWATILVKKHTDFSKERDLHYMERIETLESLIKKEFLDLINSLKNI